MESSNDVLINKIKVFFKKYPFLFNILYYTFGASFIGKSPQKAITDLSEDKIILNLGSGTRIIREHIVNVDFYPFMNVDIVADIGKLPFADNSIDAVICESVLEHVKNPSAIVNEIERVLKPGALVYIIVPFIAGFHSSPNDYYRWSKEGLRELMKDFKEEEIGIRHGPTSALLSVLNDWLATVFSFGIKEIQQVLLVFFTMVTFPFKIFDYIIYRFKSSENIAYGFYFIGTKKAKK
ncbi:MAG: class I SAM-dependent methyltransferase, partial [Candidatus Parcubacteria bacterium]|nr:class I SAM-dependent methyltransferase [Candidatus Parcubacteria bacterium]